MKRLLRYWQKKIINVRHKKLASELRTIGLSDDAFTRPVFSSSVRPCWS